MQINPDAREFGELEPLTADAEQKFAKLVEEGSIVARGPKEELERLQGDLRRAGYRKQFNTGPLRP